MTLWQTSAYCLSPNPLFFGASEKPKFGKDGATTSKAGLLLFSGLVRSGNILDTSKKLPGPKTYQDRPRAVSSSVGLHTPMNEQQRYGAFYLAFLMDKMDFKTTKPIHCDVRGELWKFVIKLRLLLPPIEAIIPICCQSFDVGKRSSQIPAGLI